MSRGPNLSALYAERRPGCCLACDRPLPVHQGPGRRPALCGRAACERVYQAAWRADRTLRERAPIRRAIGLLAALIELGQLQEGRA